MPTTGDVSTHPTSSCGELAELGFRLRTVNVGVLVTLAMVAAIVSYAALTPASPHRPTLVALALGAALFGAVVRSLPHRRLMVAGRHDLLLGGWNAGHVALAAICATLDGGPTSPYALIFFVSVAFAAASLPRPAVAVIACLNLAALLTVAQVVDQWPAVLLMWAVALCAVAAVGTLIAGERWRRGMAVQSAQHELLERLARMVEYRDNDTGGHVTQMSEYASIIAAHLGWTPSAAAELRVAAAMHDVGKISIPDDILRKPGPLTSEERAIMQTHTVVGHEMLSGSQNPVIQRAAEIALTHHERWDGAGYPRGLRGQQIPLAGRIVAVADVFDALTSDRVYRPALPVSEARRIIEDGRSTTSTPRSSTHSSRASLSLTAHDFRPSDVTSSPAGPPCSSPSATWSRTRSQRERRLPRLAELRASERPAGRPEARNASGSRCHSHTASAAIRSQGRPANRPAAQRVGTAPRQRGRTCSERLRDSFRDACRSRDHGVPHPARRASSR